MYYVDSQRTLTRRESSLVFPRRSSADYDLDLEGISQPHSYSSHGIKSGRAPPSSTRLTAVSESATSMITRSTGSIEREVVTSLFESMLHTIIDSWEVISKPTYDTAIAVLSEGNFNKKKRTTAKSDKKGKSRSKLNIDEQLQPTPDPMQVVWWSGPDEKAIIRFKNGNVYEGNISMKRMNGEGRFQWADGTVYMGNFDDNIITGRGKLQWKDDCWYEGEFSGNLRHGKGTYVDSRRQRSYCGEWHLGTKNGNGVMYYSGSFNSSYDGEWQNNVRHGYGIQEYCKWSGYKGDWEYYVRDGKGIMIWPNHDFYAGDWKNGAMSGFGTYLWQVFFNNTMTLPTLTGYDGQWLKGDRHGFGTLELGLGLGSYYKGQFKNKTKHGHGQLVTNVGLILIDKELFTDDLFGNLTNRPLPKLDVDTFKNVPEKTSQANEPYQFNICDDSVGLHYHIQEALLNIDRAAEVRARIIHEYFEINKDTEIDPKSSNELDNEGSQKTIDLEDFITFEKYSLNKAIKCYQTQLKDIYDKYSNVCTSEKVHFTPVMIRLYLWQFYYDCEIHERGITLVDVDRTFHKNTEFLSMRPHNPFESIQFWQFLQSVVLVSVKLFAQRQFPGPKPETILATAFRTFMENVALPACGRFKGHLVQEFGSIISLKGLYELYRSIGEPHTVRAFVCAARRAPHLIDHPPPELIDVPEECVPNGRNVYVFGDEMVYVVEDETFDYTISPRDLENEDLCLHNFGNLSSKSIIKIFADIFPEVCGADKVRNLEVEITFLEFFEAFMFCAKESVRVKEEENRWREMMGV